LEAERRLIVPHSFLNGKDHSSSVNLFLKLAQSASIEEVVEDLAEIASEKGIHLHSVMVKRGRFEREFKPPNAVAVVGRISELAAGVEGGQTVSLRLASVNLFRKIALANRSDISI
jgi:hypothetical protein